MNNTKELIEFLNSLHKGATLEQYQTAYAWFCVNKPQIELELKALKKEALIEIAGSSYKSDTKPKIIAYLLDTGLLSQFALEGYSYTWGQDPAQVLHNLITGYTQADLDAKKERFLQRQNDYQQKLESLKKPQTLEEYQEAHRYGIKFTPEQLQAYDLLAARESMAKRQKPILPVGDVIDSKHTKTGQPLYVVRLGERVDRDAYNALNAQAKTLGGYYSSYTGGGAIAGFTFVDKNQAQTFADSLQIEGKEHPFIAQAQRMLEDANATLNQDRKVNTHRRANFARRAEEQANKQIAKAQTMLALANTKTEFLTGVKTQTSLDTILGIAQQEKITYPQYKAWASDLTVLANQLAPITGCKLIAQRLAKCAEDGMRDYLKFAKDNILAVSKFTKGQTLADFGTEDAAQRAIVVSGVKDKAIALQVKRGQWRVILSPKEAENLGLYEPKDKMIALSHDFALEVIERMQAHKVYQVWQLLSAHEKIKRLKAANIFTGFELRCAIRELETLKHEPKPLDKIKELERAQIGRKNDGLDFFPTPKGVVQTMVELAQIQEGMTVLEPSAGMGHIADHLGDCDVCELDQARAEILRAKGHNVVEADFLCLTAKYDRIVMNPPFSDRRDCQHIKHAFSLLNEGGRLVAIAGEGVFFGQDAKAQEFRQWLDSVGATVDRLESGTFNDPNLPVNTAASARLIVIEK